MKNFIIALLSTFALATPALAEPEIKEWKTYDAMGCMLLQECTDGVKRVTKIQELQEKYKKTRKKIWWPYWWRKRRKNRLQYHYGNRLYT